MNKIFTRDQIAPVVMNLRQPQDKNRFITGTGTFVATPMEKLYIITASHVARNMNNTGHIVIGDATSKPEIIKWDSLIKDISIPWQHHKEADIAVAEINPQQTTLKKLTKRFLPIEIFSKEHVPPSRDLQLTSLGFPLGLGINGYFSPLTFLSRASSDFITLPRFDTETPCAFFILEDPSIGGYSGCPVFDLSIQKIGPLTINNTTGTTCYGIMHGTISDDTGGKLAAVTPSYYLFDLIKL